MVIDNNTYLALDSKNPLIRRQAIVKLSQDGDELAIKALARVYKNDPMPELREMAKAAAKQIRQRLDAPPQTNSAPVFVMPDDPNMPISEGLRLAGGHKAAIRVMRRENTARGRFAIFSVLVTVIGVGLCVFLLGTAFERLFQQQQAIVSVAQAIPLDEQSGEVLDGNLYTATTSTGNVFYVSEPNRAFPAQGVTMVVAVTTGRAVDALGALNTKVVDAGYVLVAPVATFREDGAVDVLATAAMLNDVVGTVRARYALNNATFTLYGNGIGAEVVARYNAQYPREFGVISISNGYNYPIPPFSSIASYIVMAGGQDAAAGETAINYHIALNSANRRVLAFEVLSNAGSGELLRQLEVTINQLELLDTSS